jgi:hypothetical protein
LRSWTLAEYNAQLAGYRRAIAKVAPGMPLVGPDVSGSDGYEEWLELTPENP